MPIFSFLFIQGAGGTFSSWPSGGLTSSMPSVLVCPRPLKSSSGSWLQSHLSFTDRLSEFSVIWSTGGFSPRPYHRLSGQGTLFSICVRLCYKLDQVSSLTVPFGNISRYGHQEHDFEGFSTSGKGFSLLFKSKNCCLTAGNLSFCGGACWAASPPFAFVFLGVAFG